MSTKDSQSSPQNLALNSKISHHDRRIIEELNNELGIDIDKQLKRNLHLHIETNECQSAGIDFYKRECFLIPKAYQAWLAMQSAARKDDINIFICSAFRSYSYQYDLIHKKLKAGRALEDIISVLAPPGFSEHHTGRAIDIISDEIPELEQIFETTLAFKWLTKFAKDFNFIMSYPKNNPFGIIYEPWHWCFHDSLSICSKSLLSL